jgi:pimeloyl-ACP methyl ester carboxylesterase
MPGRARRLLLVGAVTILLAWILLGAFGFLAERSLLFQPSPYHQTPNIRGTTVLHIPVAGAPDAVALWMPPPAGACTVIYFHGNAQQLADESWIAWSFQRNGLGLLSVEYPGYGLAGGAPTEQTIYAAAAASAAYLHGTLGIPVDRTVINGWSLGAAVATEMAVRGEGSRLILVAPFTSIVDMARLLFPVHPVSLLVRDRFDTASKAPRIHVPTLILHGTADQTIPVTMGEKLGRLIPGATLVTYPGAGHDLISHEDVIRRVAAFARECPGATAHPAPEPAPE